MYFFSHKIKWFGKDANFTYELFVERYNADLANGLGNLLSRVSSIIKKNLQGQIPDPGELDSNAKAITAQAKDVASAYGGHFESRQFHLAMEDLRSLLGATDKYINDTQPWRLIKEEAARADLNRILYTGLEVVRIVSILLSPIMKLILMPY